MQFAVWIMLVVVVAFVVFDACARPGGPPVPRDESAISTQKITVDLSKRR